MKRIYNYLKKKWFLGATIMTFPAMYYILVARVGKKFMLTDNSGDLTLAGLILFVICVLINIICNYYKSFVEYKNFQNKNDMQALLRHILSSDNTMNNEKYKLVEKFLHESYHKKDFSNPFKNVEKPLKILNYLATELCNCISKITQIDREDIGISIIYKYNFSECWEKPICENVSKSSISKIIENKASTAYKALHDVQSTVFYAIKEQAIKEGHYVPSGKDENFNGSILCSRLSICCNDTDYIYAVLSITTYNKSLCENNNEIFNENLNIILSPFITRIQTELCLIYIDAYKKNNSSKKNKKIIS